MPTPAHFDNFSGVIEHLPVIEVRNDWKQGIRLHYGGLSRHPESEKLLFEVEYRGVLPAPDVKSLSAARAQLRRPARESILLPRFNREEDGVNAHTFFPTRVPQVMRRFGTVGRFGADLNHYYKAEHETSIYLLPCGTAVYLQEGIETFDAAEEFVERQRAGGLKDPFLYFERSPNPGKLWWFHIPDPAYVPPIPIVPLAYLQELERVDAEWQEEQRARQAAAEAGQANGKAEGNGEHE